MVALVRYIEPEPVPPPVAVLTEIETTEGVTSAAIDLAFIELLPIAIAVLFVAHTPAFASVSV